MYLIRLTESPLKSKKLRAYFSDGTHTDFGSRGYDDYTTHHDEDRKERYLKRHSKREDWEDYKSAGALSRWILWNEKTIEKSLKEYIRHFKL